MPDQRRRVLKPSANVRAIAVLLAKGEAPGLRTRHQEVSWAVARPAPLGRELERIG